MTPAELFLVLAMGVFILTIVYTVPKPDDKQNHDCPPHSWETVSNYKTKEGYYTGLRCSKCGHMPYKG